MSLNVKRILKEAIREVDGVTEKTIGYTVTPEQFQYLITQASKSERLKEKTVGQYIELLKQIYDSLEDSYYKEDYYHHRGTMFDVMREIAKALGWDD